MAAHALPVEPSPQAMPPGSVPGTASAPSALAYIRPDNYGSQRAADLTDFPIEAWSDERRFLILHYESNLLDGSRVTFRCRWLDEERTWRWSPYGSDLVKVIAHRLHDNADWVAKHDPGPEYPGSGRLRAARWDR